MCRIGIRLNWNILVLEVLYYEKRMILQREMCRIGIRLHWNKLVQEVLYYEKRMIL